jgi:propanol-preferring alcohol dehydrogenase
MIPKTMKAAVVQGYGQPLKIEEVPVREPGRYEVLVKVIACGVCHTDLHAVDGDWPAKPKMPLIPGHEGVGIVVACGPEAFVKEGDAVEFRGCIPLVDAAIIVLQAGKHFVKLRKTEDTA